MGVRNDLFDAAMEEAALGIGEVELEAKEVLLREWGVQVEGAEEREASIRTL